MYFSVLFLNFFLLKAGGDGHQQGGLLDINPGLIFWLFVTFLILLFILKKFAWKPMIESLDQRENSIKTALEKAEEAKNEAQRILEENKKNLQMAEQQAQKIINEGREYSNKLRQDMLEKANDEARKILDQAKLEITRKKEEALHELRATIADLAIKATEKILDETIDEKKHSQIISKYIDNLPKN